MWVGHRNKMVVEKNKHGNLVVEKKKIRQLLLCTYYVLMWFVSEFSEAKLIKCSPPYQVSRSANFLQTSWKHTHFIMQCFQYKNGILYISIWISMQLLVPPRNQKLLEHFYKILQVCINPTHSYWTRQRINFYLYFYECQ